MRVPFLLVLALAWTAWVLPAPAGGAPWLQESGAREVVAVAAHESVHTEDDRADVRGGSARQYDRRRAVSTSARSLGPPSSVLRDGLADDRATDRPAGGPDSRPRCPAAHAAPLLQVFLC
ncbi:hypothetical protein [Streptomyces omiyaensis]|uniref:Secreted protein n=1 Tax=Streptomyces omiyaensis TaxID=68247 RepID=A0ABW7BTF4_9ACTN|nr:hypothetical protein [Streptomyces omiyaensis]